MEIFASANLGAAGMPLRFDGGTLATSASFLMNRATTLAAGGLWVRDGYDAEVPVLSLTDGATKTTFGREGVRAPAFAGGMGFFVENGVIRAARAATS